MANTNSLPAYEPLCHRDREDCEDEAPPAPQHAEPTVVSVAVAGEAQAQAPEGAVSQPPAPAPVQQVPLQQSMQQTQLPPYGYPADPVVGPPMKVTQPDPLQYVAAPQAAYQYPGTTAVVQPPTYEGPHDFLLLTLVVTIFCAFLNLLSLVIGIPAIVLSALSMNSKSNKDYPRAKKYGKYAFLLTVCDVFFTLCIALLITGPVVGWNALSY